MAGRGKWLGERGLGALLALVLAACGSGSAGAGIPVPTPSTGFALTSPDVPGGRLPAEYTCDGASATLPLAWDHAPEGTHSFALIMHTTAIPASGPPETHVYWVLYEIPATLSGLPKNVLGIGTWGLNSLNGQAAYAPPCSQGPGDKVYTLTLYALSAAPHLPDPSVKVTRDVLLGAIQDRTLATATLNVVYARP